MRLARIKQDKWKEGLPRNSLQFVKLEGLSEVLPDPKDLQEKMENEFSKYESGEFVVGASDRAKYEELNENTIKFLTGELGGSHAAVRVGRVVYEITPSGYGEKSLEEFIGRAPTGEPVRGVLWTASEKERAEIRNLFLEAKQKNRTWGLMWNNCSQFACSLFRNIPEIKIGSVWSFTPDMAYSNLSEMGQNRFIGQVSYE